MDEYIQNGQIKTIIRVENRWSKNKIKIIKLDKTYLSSKEKG